MSQHKSFENTVGKGAISPFPTVFSEGLFPRASKGVIVREWVLIAIDWNFLELHHYLSINHNNHHILRWYKGLVTPANGFVTEEKRIKHANLVIR